MRRPIPLAITLLLLTACGPKGSQAGEGTPVDSTAAPLMPAATNDSARRSDSLNAISNADSVGVRAPLADSAASTPATPSTSKTAQKAEPYIGRDSAFGPTFTVDPSGKVTPIVPPKKKP